MREGESVGRLRESWDSKIWSWVPRDWEPRTTGEVQQQFTRPDTLVHPRDSCFKLSRRRPHTASGPRVSRPHIDSDILGVCSGTVSTENPLQSPRHINQFYWFLLLSFRRHEQFRNESWQHSITTDYQHHQFIFWIRQAFRTGVADSVSGITHGVRGGIRARGSNCYRG
jgi:hypothetical protein